MNEISATREANCHGKEANGFSTSDVERANQALPKTASDAFDRILRSVGGYGVWQWKVCFITGFCSFFVSLHNIGAVFLAASPKHWCKIPSLNVNASFAKEIRNFTLPWVINKDGILDHSSCEYYDLDYSIYSTDGDFRYSDMAANEVKTIKRCDSWHYDTDIFSSTLVSEFDLVCDRRWLMSVIQASYMFGILVGALIASAASDEFGRRKTTLVCTIVFFASAVSAAFSPNFEVFLLLRFFVAASSQGIYLVNFVLLMEVVEQKGRSMLPSIYEVLFVTGGCTLPLIAFFLRNWRHQQLAFGLPCCLLFLYFWILPESPRWLLMQGKFEDGLSIMKCMAETNGGKLPPKGLLQLYLEVISKEGFKPKEQFGSKKVLEFYDNLKTLVRTPNMRRRNLVNFYAWFVTSSIYFGLNFSGNNINASLYLLVFALSFVGYLNIPVKVYLLQRFGRRMTLSATITLCGVICLVILAVPNKYAWINLCLVVLGGALVGISFTTVLIYSSELTPTNIRNLAMGVSSVYGRIGCIVAPFIVDLLGEVYYAIPSTIFGVMALIAGGLSLLLPETGFSPLPESVQEIEALPK